MPQLPHELVKARAARLREAATERRGRWLDSLIRTTLPVLTESTGKGHSDNFAPVAVPGAAKGECGLVSITGRDGDHLAGAWA